MATGPMHGKKLAVLPELEVGSRLKRSKPMVKRWGSTAVAVVILAACTPGSGSENPATTVLGTTSAPFDVLTTVEEAESAAIPESVRAAALSFDGSGSAFYTGPVPLPLGEPGALIYLEALSDASAGRVYRVLYHSRSVLGDDPDVAVSGTMWVPETPPPEGGYAIVSFGHGNDGSADICANSRPEIPDQMWYAHEMNRFLAEGYVVAYTDYEGLGTPGPFMFAVPDSSARSILDAARAARDLLGPAASDRVIMYGHSLGAGAALAAGEQAAGYAPELDVRGVVALEGGIHLSDEGWSEAVRELPSRNFMQAVSSFSAAYPGIRPRDFLTAEALSDLPLLETRCDLDMVFDRTLGEAVTMDPNDIPAWAAAIQATNIKTAPLPTFLIFAELEGPQNVEAAHELAAALCEQSDAVMLETYEADHMSVLETSWPDVDAWMTARFGDAQPVGNCID